MVVCYSVTGSKKFAPVNKAEWPAERVLWTLLRCRNTCAGPCCGAEARVLDLAAGPKHVCWTLLRGPKHFALEPDAGGRRTYAGP